MKKHELDGRVFTIGRIVHYVESKDKQWPFLLTACYSANGTHKADGVIFGSNSTGIEFVGFVPYDTNKKAGTWHFPSIGMKKKAGPQAGKPLRDLTASKK